MRTNKPAMALSVGALVLLTAACQSWSGARDEPDPVSIRESVFDYDGTPDKKYLVGGGYFIVYRARRAGELFLADDSSNRLLATISLDPGEEQELIYDVNDEGMIKNLEALGIDPTKASFKLYFVPR